MQDSYTDPSTKIVYPPIGLRDNNSTGIISVILHENEDIEWTTCQGKVVGYTIIKKSAIMPVVFNKHD